MCFQPGRMVSDTANLVSESSSFDLPLVRMLFKNICKVKPHQIGITTNAK